MMDRAETRLESDEPFVETNCLVCGDAFVTPVPHSTVDVTITLAPDTSLEQKVESDERYRSTTRTCDNGHKHHLYFDW